jgi:hypothetical protein
LKKAFLIFLTSYLLINILGCTSVPLRKSPEVWFIDADADVLYRRKNDNTEYAIPIKGNVQLMKKFMCLPSEEVDYLIDGVFDAKTK